MLGKAAQSSFWDRTQEFQSIAERLKKNRVAKRTSVFDDPTMEIQELAVVIKQDITALNSAVVDLQLLCNSRNEGGVSSDTTSHSTTVVDDLRNRLMSAARWFIEVLTVRTKNLKVLEKRRQLFSSTASKETASPFVRQRPLAARTAANASAAPPPPWANGSPFPSPSPSPSPSSSSSPMFPSNGEEWRLTDFTPCVRGKGKVAIENSIPAL